MLFNPDWKKETKVDPFSLESLIAWLETMPAEKTYDARSLRNCMLGQWVASTGEARPFEISMKSHEFGLCGTFRTVAGIGSPREQLCTFGAALDRARKALVA